MKRSLFILALLAGTISNSAAQHARSNPFTEHLNPQASSILASQLLRAASKPGGAATEQLIASSFYGSEGAELVPMDSLRYVYSGDRTSMLWNLNMSSYDNNFNPMEPVLALAEGPSSQNYLAYDSAYYYGYLLSALPLSMYHVKDYDGLNRVRKYRQIYADAGAPVQQYVISYKESSFLMDTVLLQVDTSAAMTGEFETIKRLTITYDGSSRRWKDSVWYNTGDYEAVLYEYNPEGLLYKSSFYYSGDGTSYDIYERNTYTYDVMDRLTVLFNEYEGPSGLEPSYVDSFSYTGSSLLYTEDKGYYWESGAWLPDYLFAATLSSSDAYDEVVISYTDGDSLVPSIKAEMTYNLSGYLTAMYMYYEMGSDFGPDPQAVYYYYYEDLPTGVSSLPANPAIIVWPNPAGDFLNVGLANVSSVVVYNASGQQVLRQAGPGRGLSVRLPVRDLPAGLYLAELNTPAGPHKIRFVKR